MAQTSRIGKKNIMIILNCMDLDLALRTKHPHPLSVESSSDAKRDLDKYDHSNRMSLIIMKRPMPKIFRGSMSEEESSKKFLVKIKKHFIKNEKAEISTLLANLVSMKYKGKMNTREYITEMSHIAFKLKVLKLKLSKDLLRHWVLISLLAEYD